MKEINSNTKLVSIFLIVLGCLFVGVGPIIIRLYEIQNPFMVVYYRMYVSSSVFILYFLLTRKKMKISKPNNLLGMFVGFLLATDLSLYYGAMHYTAISNVSLIGNLSPIFVVGISWLFFKQKPTKTIVLGIVVAVIGLLVLVGFDTKNDSAFGNSMALTGAFFYGAYFIYLSKMINNMGPLLTNLYVTLYCSFFCFIFLIIDNLIRTDDLYIATSFMDWIWSVKKVIMPNSNQIIGLVINSLLAQVLGQTLIMRGLKNLTPSLGSIITLTEPVATVTMCSYILCESMSTSQIIGGIIILSSIILVSRESN